MLLVALYILVLVASLKSDPFKNLSGDLQNSEASTAPQTFSLDLHAEV